MSNLAQIRDMLVATFKDFNEDKAPRLAAALAYYTIFSLAPLLIIAISIAGVFFGEEAARGALSGQLDSLLGQQGAEAIQEMLAASSRQEAAGALATAVGVATLLFGAAGVFGQLQDALNTIWEVAPKPGRGVWGFIQDRFLSFAMVLGTGFLLLVSLLLSTFLSAAGRMVVGESFDQTILWQGVNLLVQAVVTFGLFTLIFKVLPDARIAWRDVLLGAGITTLLFVVGRFLIDLYLRTTGTGSTYGAIGSLIVLLIWIFYSAQILLFGAEFTQVYAQRFGSRIKPSDNAVPVTEEARAQQGMPDPETLKATAEHKDRKEKEPAPAAAEDGPVKERAVGEAPEPLQTQSRPEKQGGPGTTVIAGATIATIIGALLGKVLRRRR
jgi:membrane protein